MSNPSVAVGRIDGGTAAASRERMVMNDFDVITGPAGIQAMPSTTLNPWTEVQDRASISTKIKQMLQRVHNQAPKDKSADFYEGLSFALSLMEQQV